MTVKCLTALMLAGFAASAVLFLCVLCRDAGVRPLRAAGRFARGRGVLGCLIMLPLCATLFVRAVVKPPTNGVNGVSGPMRVHRAGGVRTPTVDENAAGFALVRAGTGEAFDFSPPPDAEVCEEWRRFGAAGDRQRVCLVDEANDGYAGFPFGTNVIRRLTVFSDGEARVATTNAAMTISPLKCVSGVLPASHWDRVGGAPSQFWSVLTPSNSFVMTWQNVAFGRDPARPVSFQAELLEDGCMEFRYDLSALVGGAASNVVAGARNGGRGAVFDELPAATTSLRFARIDPALADDPDPDGDGVATADELFVYGTNPYESDSDRDGLGDCAEINETNTDPNDAYSADGIYNDGLAVALGGLDPLSFLDGSTNSVLEHIFYSGTTNGVFAYPASTEETGVLKITVSGIGTGRLVVGDDVVPLVGSSAGWTNTLLLAIGKGVRMDLRWDVPDGLGVALDSDDLMIGELPTPLRWRGWIAFPHTDATVPCIHDLGAKRKAVSLVHGEEFAGLTAEWSCESEDVDIGNIPPVSAEITGNFSTRESRAVSYTVDHPKRLNPAPVVVAQTLRFCPCLSEDAEEAANAVAEEEEQYSWDEEPTDGEDATSEEDAADEYERIAALPSAGGVLQLHGSVGRADFVSLATPEGEPVRCCECPDHWRSNYVALAWRSWRLAVEDMAGAEFSISREDVLVSVRGTSPSRAPGGDGVLFATNGVPSLAKSYTALGVAVENPCGPPLDDYNEFSPSFGFPVTICTNLERAARLAFRTDVLLSNGVFRVAVENATAPFQIWAEGWMEWDESAGAEVWHPPALLLDSEGAAERHFTTRQWRRLVGERGYGRTLPFVILSSAAGHCDVAVSYAFDGGGSAIRSAARQRVTSVNPVLLVDFDRDGIIGATDIARHMAGRYAYFWRNDDKWKGDNAFDLPFINRVNSSDDVVNGRNDLINFLPVSVDVAPFVAHWSSGSVYYRLEAHSSALRNAKLAFADIARTQIGDAPLGEDMDVDGNALHEAPVSALGGGTNLPPAFVSLSQSGSGTIIMEFPDFARDHELYLNVYAKSDDALLFSAKLKLHVGDVSNMLGWENLRSAAGGSGGVPTRLATDDWPEDEREEGNLVFVHGYNMEEDVETQLWAQNVFKKLWWAGLDRGVIAVQWNGDRGQLFGTLTPNYYGNVQNAFQTAPALSNAMEAVQGPKWFLAHSLGNMLVSAAIQDYGMRHEKFFMLNAAIAMEALDPTNGITQTSHDMMTPSAWTNYEDRVRATHWFECFPEGDGRRLLTWKGRFANVTNIVNFYSTQEEVVNNGDGKLHTILRRNYVWYNQETRKGRWPMMLHEYEGGWEFNPVYDISSGRHMSPTNAAELTDEQLRQTPFFLDFYNPEMHTSPNGMIVASNYIYRAEMLAYAIPAESFAVGANPIPGRFTMTTNNAFDVLYDNYDMGTLFISGRDDLPANDPSDTRKKHRDWQHSSFVQRSYKRVHQLYKEIIKHIKEAQYD